MNRTLFGIAPLLLAGLLGSAPLGCASVAEDEDVDTSEGELRQLSAQEVVGDIAFGTTAMEVQHPGETGSRRTYVAVRFQAAAGDEIEALSIAGNAADPVLYLLGENFQTLTSNDDAEPGDKSSQITRKLSKAGTYYLAMRTKEGWRTKFYVSLRKKGASNPPPPPPPPPSSWKDAFAGHDLWGASFEQLLPTGGFSGGRIPLACRIWPKDSVIRCAAHSYDYSGSSATIAADGTFSQTTGTANSTGGELVGKIALDGTVTITRYRYTECFQTSSRWCESRATDGQGIPANTKAFELCRTPDQNLPAGGWVSGYYLACSKCEGRCEGGR